MNTSDSDDNSDPVPTSSDDDSDSELGDGDRDLDGDGCDSLFQYNENDVNAFFEKVMFDVGGNTDPRLKRLGEWLIKACDENNLIQVVRGTLHLAVLYQAEKMAMGPRLMAEDEGTLTLKQKKKERRQRRLKHSTINQENDFQTVYLAGWDGNDVERSIRPDVIGVVHDVNDYLQEEDIEANNDDMQENDWQTEGYDDEDDDSQSIWSDLMERFYDVPLEGEDVIEAIVDEDELSGPSIVLSEDTEIVAADPKSGQASSSELPHPIPNIDEFEILSQSVGEASTPAEHADSTEASNSDSIQAKHPCSTQAKDPDSTQAKDPCSTQAKDPDSTQAKDPDSTQAKDPDSTQAKDSTESTQFRDSTESTQARVADSTQAKDSTESTQAKDPTPTIDPTPTALANESPKSNETLDELPTRPDSAGLAPNNTEPQQEEDAFDYEELPPPDVENEDSRSRFANKSLEIQRNNPKPTCHICKKTFPSESKLKVHLRVHAGDRAFPCPYPGCGTAFNRMSYLTRHLFRHYSTAAKDCSRKRNSAGKLDFQQSTRSPESEGDGVQKNASRRQSRRKKRRFDDFTNTGHDDDELSTNSDSAVLLPTTEQREEEDVFELEEEELDKSKDPDYDPDSSEDSDSALHIEDFKTLEKLRPPVIENEETNQSSAKISTKETSEIQRNKPKHTCHVCKEAFPNEWTLKRHFHTGDRPFPCPHPGCGAAFNWKSHLTRHLLKVNHKMKPNLKTNRAKTPALPAKNFSKKGNNSTKLAVEENLKPHLSVHTNTAKGKKPLPFPCPHPGCGKAFKRKDNMTRHFLLHTAKRPYKCNFPKCSEDFRYAGDLKRHQECHKRPFQCDFQGCFSTYTLEKDLKIHHTKMHANATAISATSTQADDLQHQETIKKHFKCDFPGCSASFGRGYCLQLHKLSHAVKKPFKCHNCGTGFNDPFSVKRHREACTNNNVKWK